MERGGALLVFNLYISSSIANTQQNHKKKGEGESGSWQRGKRVPKKQFSQSRVSCTLCLAQTDTQATPSVCFSLSPRACHAWESENVDLHLTLERVDHVLHRVVWLVEHELLHEPLV